MVNLEWVSFLSPCLTGSNQPCRYQGKTTYLYLRMVESMIEGRPFLFQAIQGTVYHVAERGVKVVRSWSSEETIVAFVDADKYHEPRCILFCDSVQLIVASPPKGINPHWTEQADLGTSITQLVTELWLYKELLLTGLVIALLSSLD